MIESLANAVGLEASNPQFWLPLLFLALLVVVVLAGMLLDGFDLGVGSLSLVAPEKLQPRMLSLLNPWRDANEYWLLLALTLFACAFPNAWGAILSELYLPLMGLGLGVMLRMASYELRLRSPDTLQHFWLVAFGVGSLITAFVHGVLLAKIVSGFATGVGYSWFAVFMGCCAMAGYMLLGASWLIMREAGELRARAVRWASRSIRWFAAGVIGASVVLALANPGILLKWSEGINRWWLLMLWAGVLASFISIEICLQRMINSSYRTTALPFVLTVFVLIVVLSGLVYSFFPFLVLDELTVWDGAASQAVLWNLIAILSVCLPVLVLFNVRVYWGMVGLSKPPLPPRFKG